jgi:putative flippase GtrA
VVNDGSSSINSNNLLDQINDINNVDVINHSSNQGKGSALKTGIEFLKYNKNNIDGIITVDSDGQHQLEDILKVATSSTTRKDDVLFGVRSFEDGTPLRSRLGNKLTKYLLYLFNGISIDDTQTGLRYLPTSLFSVLLNLPGNRYEFELECLFTIRNLGYSITQIPIKTIYIDGNSDSHFRPIIDSAKIYLVFARFSLSSLLSFGLDITIFAVLLSYLDSILISTIVARVLSGIFNFTLNRTIVFRSNRSNSLLIDAGRYILLWATLAIFSGLIVSTAQGLDAYLIIPFKIMIDLLLFIIAFYVQKNIVFKSR